MFNNMRNQLKEKTGKDIPKFNAQRGSLSRSSRHGSTSSLGSIVLDANQSSSLNSNSTSPTQDVHQIKLTDGKVLTPKEVNIIAKKEDEWRSKLERKDNEWTKKFEKRESELLKELKDKENDWRIKEHSLTEDLLKQTTELKEALRLAEEYKNKVIHYQEDKDQLEGFQTQEMAKVKHLLLAKERENAELSSSLKEATSTVESLRSEVTRLKPFEEQIADLEEEVETVRHASEKERAALGRRLTEREEEVRHLEERVALLAQRSTEAAANADSTPDARIQTLLGERTLLERKLEEAHIHLTDIKASWSAQISSLETQVERVSRQAGEEGAERRRAEQRVAELEAALNYSKTETDTVKSEVANAQKDISRLEENVSSLKTELGRVEMEKEEALKKISQLEVDLKESEDGRVAASNDAKYWQERSQKESDEFAKAEKERSLAESRAAAEMAAADEARAASAKAEDARKAAEEESAQLTLRNAQLSQAADMERHAAAELRVDVETANKRLAEVTSDLETAKNEVEKWKTAIEEERNKFKEELEGAKRTLERCKDLEMSVENHEHQLNLRNQHIKTLQQTVVDLRKTLKELKGDGDGPATLAVQSENHRPIGLSDNHRQSIQSGQITDVNLQYLRHVIMKFLTSSEYEAHQLTKVVSTLLQLSPEEELLIKDTLDWRMSWFRSRPKLQDYYS